MPRYQDVLDDLRKAYDGGAAERDQVEKTPWKLAERSTFLERLRASKLQRLLEVGAGTGQDSAFFREQGFDVVATDLSRAMVEHCQAKGIESYVMDFLHLDFAPESFDAAYALNCMLHVPNADLPGVLERIHMILRPGGLFYLGAYGGHGDEGIAEWDAHDPPRFFSWRTNEQMQRFASQLFEIEDFHVVEIDEIHFQSLTLRRP